MGILLSGFIAALISWVYKPAGIIIAAIALAPFVYAIVAGPIHVMIDPSSVQQATSGIVTATTNYIVADLLSYPRAVLFGSLIGLFSPGA